MPRVIAHLSKSLFALCLLGMLAACQTGLPGTGSDAEGVTPNAVTGGEIEVTALDDVPGEAGADAKDIAAPEPEGSETAAAQEAPPATAEEPEATAAEPAPKADLAETPKTPKSDMQLACEKKRGSWSKVGKGNVFACVYNTKDAGKQCTRESQCEGVCLARSGTCSPLKPLYGCNEILQDNGARVTLCIE
jgi:hypothetical protein